MTVPCRLWAEDCRLCRLETNGRVNGKRGVNVMTALQLDRCKATYDGAVYAGFMERAECALGLARAWK